MISLPEYVLVMAAVYSRLEILVYSRAQIFYFDNISGPYICAEWDFVSIVK